MEDRRVTESDKALRALLRHRWCPHHAGNFKCKIAERDGCACREAVAAIAKAFGIRRDLPLFSPTKFDGAAA